MDIFIVFVLMIVFFVVPIFVIKKRMSKLRTELINEIGDKLEKSSSAYSTRELVEIKMTMMNEQDSDGYEKKSSKIPDNVIGDLNTIFVFENDQMFYGHQITDFKDTVELATDDNDKWKNELVLAVPRIPSKKDPNKLVEAEAIIRIEWPYDRSKLNEEELSVLDTITSSPLDYDMWVTQTNTIREAQKDYLIRVKPQKREELRERFRKANYDNDERRELSYIGEDSQLEYQRSIREQERNNPYKKQFESLQKEQHDKNNKIKHINDKSKDKKKKGFRVNSKHIRLNNKYNSNDSKKYSFNTNMIDSLNAISDPKGDLLSEVFNQQSLKNTNSQFKSEYVKKIYDFYNQR